MIRRSSIVAALCVVVSVPSHAAAPQPELLRPVTQPSAPPKFTNRLAKERSPYLLQHAHNPVDWYPWGAEAFEKAKRENKPIFLSVGYSTCHWCHVMEREAFSDEAVAKLINDHFVPIKVDREERPDVDRVYMEYVQAATGGGGWPMTVLLTPDLKPFFGGTYFPVEDKLGRPGLKSVLTQSAAAWRDDREKIVQGADKIATALQNIAKGKIGEADANAKIEQDALKSAYEELKGEFDEKAGGFGTAPKFPQPPTLAFLLRYARRAIEPAARDMVLTTLRKMADGGVHDQLGGGFHRYSTDGRWFLPHFEKMLYDQAQLAGVYLDGYLVSGDASLVAVARDVLEYVLRDMTGPQGQFYSAEDADSAVNAAEPERKAEGAFYVWSAEDIEQALGADSAKVFAFHYGVAPRGNVASDPRGEFRRKNVLAVVHTVDETARQFGRPKEEVGKLLADAKEKLHNARDARPRPYRDDKAIAAWNALAISAFARAGAALDEPRYTEAAVRAAAFLRDHLYDARAHRLGRVWRDGPAGGGFLDDYAYFVQALLDLYESTLDVRWLRLAIDVQAGQDERFEDKEAGGYFKTAAGDPSVLLRLKDDFDQVEPGGNAAAAMNLLRLAQMTDDPAYAAKADRLLKLYAGRLKQSPTALPALLAAVDFHLGKPRQIVLAGDPGSPEVRAMLRAVHSQYMPNRIILSADGGEGQRFLGQRLEFIREMKPLAGGRATAYVCENYACKEPANDLATLRRQLGGP